MAERLFTCVIDVPRTAQPVVKAALATMQANPAGNALLSSGQLPMVHFASFTLFDAEQDHATLVIEANIDTSVDEFLTALVAAGKPELDAMLRNCPDYQALWGSPADVVSYLKTRVKRPQLYHVGHPNRSVEAITGDFELRRSIAALLAREDLKAMAPARIIDRLRVEAGGNFPNVFNRFIRVWYPVCPTPGAPNPTPLDQFTWEKGPHYRPHPVPVLLLTLACVVTIAAVVIGQKLQIPPHATITFIGLILAFVAGGASPDNRVLRGAVSAVAIIWLTRLFFWAAARWHLWTPPDSPFSPPLWFVIASAVVLAVSLGLLLSFLNIARRLEVTKPIPRFSAAQRASVKTLLEAEDRPEHSIYNHVAGLSSLRTDYRFLRRLRTNLATRFLNLIYRTYYLDGKLAAIPTIHFAQWCLVDDRHLLFLTNYDGAADSYLDDFFDSLAGGVAFIWDDTQLFPRTSDPRLLKLWVRKGQTLASVRYRAPVYNALTVGAINNNTFIRRRLLFGWRASSAAVWMRRFATTPAQTTAVERAVEKLEEFAGLREPTV